MGTINTTLIDPNVLETHRRLGSSMKIDIVCACFIAVTAIVVVEAMNRGYYVAIALLICAFYRSLNVTSEYLTITRDGFSLLGDKDRAYVVYRHQLPMAFIVLIGALVIAAVFQEVHLAVNAFSYQQCEAARTDYYSAPYVYRTTMQYTATVTETSTTIRPSSIQTKTTYALVAVKTVLPGTTSVYRQYPACATYSNSPVYTALAGVFVPIGIAIALVYFIFYANSVIIYANKVMKGKISPVRRPAAAAIVGSAPIAAGGGLNGGFYGPPGASVNAPGAMVYPGGGPAIVGHPSNSYSMGVMYAASGPYEAPPPPYSPPGVQNRPPSPAQPGVAVPPRAVMAMPNPEIGVPPAGGSGGNSQQPRWPANYVARAAPAGVTPEQPNVGSDYQNSSAPPATLSRLPPYS